MTGVGELARLTEHATGAKRSAFSRVSAGDFRNLRSVNVSLPEAGVVLIGDNGHGKSNFLEALRYFTILRSARGASDADLVRHGQNGFFIAAEASVSSERRVTVGFDRHLKKKKVVVDDVVANRLSDAFGSVIATLLSPTDAQLVSGGPGERRRYLDMLLSLIDARYLAALQRYRAALLRRNAALRDSVRHGGDEMQVSVWEPALAEAGALLWQRRAEWCERSAPELNRLCGLIGERGATGMAHVRHGGSPELSEQGLLDSLAAHRRSDMRRGMTSSGPHRDDLRFTIDEKDMRMFGSGGQHHTLALALRFLETFSLRDRYDRWPVLLLDDPFAELDATRAARILRLIEDAGHGQVILAVPRVEDVPSDFTSLARWQVRDGEIEAGA